MSEFGTREVRWLQKRAAERPKVFVVTEGEYFEGVYDSRTAANRHKNWLRHKGHKAAITEVAVYDDEMARVHWGDQ